MICCVCSARKVTGSHPHSTYQQCAIQISTGYMDTRAHILASTPRSRSTSYSHLLCAGHSQLTCAWEAAFIYLCSQTPRASFLLKRLWGRFLGGGILCRPPSRCTVYLCSISSCIQHFLGRHAREGFVKPRIDRIICMTRLPMAHGPMAASKRALKIHASTDSVTSAFDDLSDVEDAAAPVAPPEWVPTH